MRKSDASYKKVKPVSGVSWGSTYDGRENLESMLFSSNETWTVNDTYNLGTYGELGLATGGRLVAADGQGAVRLQGRGTSRPRGTPSVESSSTTGPTRKFDSTTSRGHTALHHPVERTSGSVTRPG